jgi:hypothetical protein
VKLFRIRISEPIVLSLRGANPDMWDELLKTYEDILFEIEQTFMVQARCVFSQFAF